MKNLTRILLLAGILLLINLLSRQFFFRIDATKDKQYTLSSATKNILKDMEEPVSITAYFTKDLPAQYAKNYTDLRDLLIEYNTRSGGMLDYEFIDPEGNDEIKQEAMQNGIAPLLINVREKDKVVQKNAFMGAIVSSGDNKDVINYFPPGGAVEYQLTTSIKKVVSIEKPTVAISQGFGSPPFQELQLLQQSMQILYNVTSIDLSSGEDIDPSIRCIAIINPADSIPSYALDKLDDYISKGGNVAVAYNNVTGDFQSMQGGVLNTGISNWLLTKGVAVNKDFVLDASAASVTVQQRQGFFTVNSQVEFPFFPMIKVFEEHPITKGIEQVAFQMVSSIDASGNNNYSFTPLIKTSQNTAVQSPPIVFEIQRQWRQGDFPDGPQTIAGVISPITDSPEGSIVVFSDGDFIMGAQSRGQTPDNISLFANAIDFLSDDTGLIDLRTKGVASRPIKDMEEADMTRVKWINFGLPILLVLILGFVRYQRGQRLRMKRMTQNFS